jgi:hypothetical protein
MYFQKSWPVLSAVLSSGALPLLQFHSQDSRVVPPIFLKLGTHFSWILVSPSIKWGLVISRLYFSKYCVSICKLLSTQIRRPWINVTCFNCINYIMRSGSLKSITSWHLVLYRLKFRLDLIHLDFLSSQILLPQIHLSFCFPFFDLLKTQDIFSISVVTYHFLPSFRKWNL